MGSRSITASELERMLVDQDAEPQALPLSLLSEITNDFSPDMVIGRGGFAVVYKGKLESAHVAVKSLSWLTHMNVDDFNSELGNLMKVKHKNIVRFLGYCADTNGYMEENKGKLIMSDTEKRLLCFEYHGKGSLDKHIKDPSEAPRWSIRYQIIKGICEGLLYLHRMNIVHSDLKPRNILLDDNFIPKITDFGTSKYLDENRTHLTVAKVGGTFGYLAPEYTSGKITRQLDLYSLGVIIIKILTGEMICREVADVHRSWSNWLDTSYAEIQWAQIEACTKIAIECTDSNPKKRPAMEHILARLAEMESANVIPADLTRKLLDVHPHALYVPFEPNMAIFCSLQLTNNTDRHVIFKLVSEESSGCFLELPMYGFVLPRSRYTLIVKSLTKDKLPETSKIGLLLHSANLGDQKIEKFQEQITEKSQRKAHHFFDNAEEMGMVEVVKLLAHCTPRPERGIKTFSKQISAGIKICSMGIIPNDSLCSIDANTAKQWIITGEKNGYVRIFNYQTQTKVDSLRVWTERVTCVKFIKRKQWFVVATAGGHLDVYTYEQKMPKIKSFRAADECIVSLAVHRTKSYLLSASNPCLPGCGPNCNHKRKRVAKRSGMKLWNWDQGWECINTFADDNIFHVAFNSEDTIASCGLDDKVKVWSLGSSEKYHTLEGHSGRVNCLDFFTRDGQEYLATGSDDRTAKVWDLQKKERDVCTLTATSPVRSILYQPKHEILITGSDDRTFYFWSATNNFRLDRVINIGCLRKVQNLACLVGSVAIGNENLSSVIMDLDDANNYQEKSTGDCSETQLSTHHTNRPVHKTCEITEGSSSTLPILDVHPQELHFPCEPDNKPMSCLLHLTNNTDETVAFRLMNEVPAEDGECPALKRRNRMDRLFEWQLFDSAVPPRSNYTLVVTTTVQMKKPFETDFRLILQSSTSQEKYLGRFANDSECRTFFHEAIETGNAVHSVKLKAVYGPSQIGRQSEPANPPRLKVCTHFLSPMVPGLMDIVDQPVDPENKDQVCCLDAHPTEPWIMTGHFSGKARIWNYDSQSINPSQVEVSRRMIFGASSVSKEALIVDKHYPVRCIKFIARKKWIMLVTGLSDIIVYSYVNLPGVQRIMKCGSHNTHSIVVHPTKPCVMSVSTFELFQWSKSSLDKKQKFDARIVKQVVFNPEDPNSFASAELRRDGPDSIGVVKVWSIDTATVKYTMSGHSAEVSCLDFFTSNNMQYLITGSKDCTAKIWDLKEKVCKHTMEAIKSPVIAAISLPGRPYLVTASESGIVHVWSSTNFSLKRILNPGVGGFIRSLVCMMGSKSVLIWQAYKLSIVDIEDDEAAPVKGSN